MGAAAIAWEQRLDRLTSILVGSVNCDDGVGPELELRLDLDALPAVGTPPLSLVPSLFLAALHEPAVENDLNGSVRSEALAKVFVEVRVPAGDNKQGPPHSLPRCAGNCDSLRAAFRDTTATIPAKLIGCQTSKFMYIYTTPMSNTKE